MGKFKEWFARLAISPRDVPSKAPNQLQTASLVKVVYFDEQSASDYLDIAAGGSASSTTAHVQTRTTAMQAAVESKLAARVGWLPFMGASTEIGSDLAASQVGQSILSKTLSNTILTDYLAQVEDDPRVRRLRGFRVIARSGSMAFVKMYTPYMVAARTEDQGIDLARLDEALEKAKGYYELIAEIEDNDTQRCVLRFNIAAFRNNYGLTDLGRMHLVFHAIKVGQTAEADLSIDAEMAGSLSPEAPTALELLGEAPEAADVQLDVYDVLLAGVEHGD